MAHVERANGGGGVRNLELLGVRPDDFLDPLPELSEAAEQAARLWHFADGWAPERWAVFAQFEHVADWAALIEMQDAIRRAQRKETWRD